MKDGRVNYLRLAAIWGYVYLNPGCRQAHIARGLGLHRSNTLRHLPVMDKWGLFLWEDNDGRIYPYRVSRSRDAASI